MEPFGSILGALGAVASIVSVAAVWTVHSSKLLRLSFFLIFVKKPNKIRPSLGSDVKTCRHTTYQIMLDIKQNTCFLYGHVCTHHKTPEQGWV